MQKKENLPIPQNLEPNIQNIENQIKIIDELLSSGTTLDTSDDIKIKCSDRSISKEAPYHNKQDSTKDAYIVFSALKHFEELGQDFLFISANKNDFGDPQNLETKIHPELTKDYPSVKVRYFSEIGRAITELKEELPILLLPEQVSSEKLNNTDNSIEIDSTKHILDQIYDYVSFIRKELDFYPINLFVNHYPFRTSDKTYSYHSIFTLNIDNPKLFELFSVIEITENNTVNITNTKMFENVDDCLNKIKFVVNSLSKNLIFSISDKSAINSVRVRFYDDTECKSPLYDFKVFKFVECFNNLNSFSDSKEDLQKSYYLNYLIGNYVTAVEKQKRLLNIFQKEKQNTHCFVSQFNLSKLYNFFFRGYFNDASAKKVEEELKQIDLKCEARKFSTKENRKLINYISENQFYRDAKDKIQISTNKLIDQYHSSLNGGWSFNSEIWNLISEFGIVESFLSSNCIVFNKFSEFNELFATFTEGLFASHSTKDSNNGRNSKLEEFDDWLIHNLLTYGDSKIINKFYKRYKLKKIIYKKTSHSDAFVDLIDNYFNNSELIELFNNNNSEKSNRHFWEYYEKIFKNILTLVSICNFDSTYIREFTQKLINYLDKGYVPRDFVDYIITFLYRCGKELDGKTLQKIFNLAIDNPLFHKTNYFETLFYVIDRKKVRLSIDEERFEKIMKFVFVKCFACDEKHSEEIIIQIYNLIDNQVFKDRISDVINKKLQKEFDFDLFYNATLYEVIPFDENLFATALADSYPQEPHLTYKGALFGEREQRYSKIDEILNLCFKLNIATNIEEFQSIKKLDKYYEWLVDMDNFDYNYFEPKWINEYTTRYYYKKFHNCKLIKEKLNKIIKEKFEEQIERDYINIYVRKTWRENVCT